MESSKEDKNINAKVAEVAAGVEKLAVSKKKKLKFVKVNPNEINIVITDGRGREPEVKKEPHKVSNQFHSKQGQDSNRKSSNYNVDFNRNANSNRSSNSTSAPTSTSRNMARGGGKHSSGSSNYKADFEVNNDQYIKSGKKSANNFDNDKDKSVKSIANDSNIWEENPPLKKNRSHWKNLEANINTTNKTRERLMHKGGEGYKSKSDLDPVDRSNATSSILDSSIYQNTYDSKARSFDHSKISDQLFSSSAIQDSLVDKTSELQSITNNSALKIQSSYGSVKDDKLFVSDSLYSSPTANSFSYSNAATSVYPISTASSSSSNTASAYSVNSFMSGATSNSYSSITNSPLQQSGSVYSPHSNVSFTSTPQYPSTFTQPQFSVANSYSNETSSSNIYSQQNVYGSHQHTQPSSTTHSQHGLNTPYVYPQSTISSQSSITTTNSLPTTASSQKYMTQTQSMSYHGHNLMDGNKPQQTHTETKTSHDGAKSGIDHMQYVGPVDYPSYMGHQYQDSGLKDVKSDPMNHFEFRSSLDMAPMLPMDSYMTNYIQPAPPQTSSDFKMMYWNNVPVPNILHAPPPQPAPHNGMFKYPSHMPYDMPNSQATQKPNYPLMKMNDNTPSTDSYMNPSQMRTVHHSAMPTHRYPVDNTNTNKLPLAYSDPQPPSFQSTLNDYQRYQGDHHFNDFGNYQPPASVQHNYQQNDPFGTSDIPNRIHPQSSVNHHQYFDGSSENPSQRYQQEGGMYQQRNKRAITGGSGNQQMFGSRNSHYTGHPHAQQYQKPMYDDKENAKPVPHTSGNIYGNSKYDNRQSSQHSNEEYKIKPRKQVSTGVVTSVASTSTTVTPVSSSAANVTAGGANISEPNFVKHNKSTVNSPSKVMKPNEKLHKQHHETNQHSPHSGGIKTINFNQFTSNVVRNYRALNNKAAYENKANKSEMKVTKIMQRPVDESNKDEIAKLPIPLGNEKTDEKSSKDKDNSTDSTTSNASSAGDSKNKKANNKAATKNIQILSPVKQGVRKESTEESSKGSDSKQSKPDDSESKGDNEKTTKKDDKLVKKDEAKSSQQKKKYNNYQKYSRNNFTLNGWSDNMNDMHFVPYYNASFNKYNKYAGYPQADMGYYDSYEYYDFYPENSYNDFNYAHGGQPPFQGPLYNSYSKKDSKLKKSDSNEKKNNKSDQQTGGSGGAGGGNTSDSKSNGTSKKSSKKIKFKKPEIIKIEESSSSSNGTNVEIDIIQASSNANPSGILKNKSKNNETLNLKEFKENLDKTIKQQQKEIEADEKVESDLNQIKVKSDEEK